MIDLDRLRDRLLAPRDPAALVVFRIAFGLLITTSAVRFLAYGWIDDFFVRPQFHFKYWGFGWLPLLPPPWIHAAFVLLAVLGLCVAAGLFYRIASVSLFLVFTYVQLLDVATYLNHYYLVSLLAGLMCLIPAHRAFSLDVLRRPALRAATLPAWCTDLLRFQVAVVYVNAGLAKLTGDWLLHAQPLNIWLAARTSVPVIGPFLDERWVAFAASWGGWLFDTSVAFALLARRTRPFAFAAVVLFHLATWVMFPIGMFPFIMITAALVFFDPAWPRRLLARLPPPASLPQPEPPAISARLPRAALAVAAVYGLIQIAVPLRAHLYGGNVLWHEQGMRFAWKVMTREKNGSVTFVVHAPRTGRTWHVPPRRVLTALQEQEMSVQPDLILQVAHHLARTFDAKGLGPVEVRADARVSLNGRPAAVFIDPDVDLARETDGLLPKRWIAPAPATTPLHLRPALASHL